MSRRDTRLVVQAWLGTRLLFALVAATVAVIGRRGLDSVVPQWDVLHFFTIARDGYANPQEMAFFPGLPLVLHGGTLVGLPMVGTGTVLALAGSLAAALALGRLGGTWAAVAWLLAPTGVFTAVPYTEAPFCAAAFWAWERASRGRWWQAGVLAALACTLRVSGLFLVGALLVVAVEQAWRGRRRRGSTGGRAASETVNGWVVAGALLLPGAVLAAYVGYLYGLTGSWTAWFSAQAAGWQRGFHWPWEALANTVGAVVTDNPAHPEWVWVFRAELVAWCVGFATTVVLLVRRRVAEASWVGVQVLAFSLSFWLMSVNRAVLLWFPLWTMLGRAVEGRPTRTRTVLGWVGAVLALAVQGTWAWLYFTGRWAS